MVTTSSTPGLQAQVTEEIRVLLVRRRMTARELAERLGWTQSALSRRLTGQAAFSLDDLEKVAEAFDIAAHELLPGTEPRFITRREWLMAA